MEIVLADSSEIVRIGLRTLIRIHFPDWIITDAQNGDQLLQIIQNRAIEILLIDYTGKNFSLQQISKLKEKNPKMYCIALSYLQSGITLTNSLKAGVDSYIKKECAGEEIVKAIQKTITGERFFCKDVLEVIQQDQVPVQKIHFAPQELEKIQISPREKEIIGMIALGLTNQEIADHLFLSAHTVNTHRRNIMQKLNVNNTAGLVMYAIKNQLISPNKFLFSS